MPPARLWPQVLGQVEPGQSFHQEDRSQGHQGNAPKQMATGVATAASHQVTVIGVGVHFKILVELRQRHVTWLHPVCRAIFGEPPTGVGERRKPSTLLYRCQPAFQAHEVKC